MNYFIAYKFKKKKNMKKIVTTKNNSWKVYKKTYFNDGKRHNTKYVTIHNIIKNKYL